MSEIRYIHVADLHLDTPFSGISHKSIDESGQLSKKLQEATFLVLDRLVKLCEREKPDFLVIAGDIYNEEEYSIKAQLRLRDCCLKLNNLHILVYIVHGNHDPLSSQLSSIKWPPNVFIFDSDKPSSYIFEKNGETLAVIHGISHEASKESRNLATLFNRDPNYNCFQLGILHCSIENYSNADRYAPCILEDLIKSKLDAWALGHIHERKVLCESPFIAYSGNTQGLHINEIGTRGCLLVTAKQYEGSWICKSEFQPLNTIQWQKICIDVSQMTNIGELCDKLNDEIDFIISNDDTLRKGVILRVRLEGRTSLDHELRKPETIEQLSEYVSQFSKLQTPVWIKDFELATSRETILENYLDQKDLPGEAIRLYQSLKDSPDAYEDIVKTALSPLFEHTRFSKDIPKLSEEQIREIFSDAAHICLDILEGR